jgi:hypothetical protein
MNEPATREDLQQTADAIRAEMRSTADDIRAEMRSTAEDIRAEMRHSAEGIRQEQQRTAENILHLIGSLTERMDQRFDAVDRRFGSVENHIGRLGETVGSLIHQSAGFTRWAEQLDRSNAQILAIQEAQQHYLDKLADRTLRLEQRPPQ